MMDFGIFLQQEAELHGDLAGLAHGFFQLSSSGIDVRFFERGCMVFITLSTFLDDLLRNRTHKSATFRWVGEDNGRTFTLKKKDKLLEINK
jgi:hypothetical protein